MADYEVETEDGYLINIFRIQKKNQKNFKTGLPVVFLMHGLGASCETWLLN